MVGFVYSFPAFFGKKLCQHSHQLAVLPKYRGSGIGKKLKWAQRSWALKEGYDLLTWTFDPLQARNANLNFHTLGAVSKTYLPNFYEATSLLSLAPGVPTDRFLTEWHLKDKEVERRKKNKFDSYDLAQIPRILERKSSKDRNLYPSRPLLRIKEKFALVEVPQDINLLRQDPALILKWQQAIQQVMSHYFRRGYWCIDFVYGERSFYVLERKAKSSLIKNKRGNKE